MAPLVETIATMTTREETITSTEMAVMTIDQDRAAAATTIKLAAHQESQGLDLEAKAKVAIDIKEVEIIREAADSEAEKTLEVTEETTSEMMRAVIDHSITDKTMTLEEVGLNMEVEILRDHSILLADSREITNIKREAAAERVEVDNKLNHLEKISLVETITTTEIEVV
jgi:hypothetical protein